VPSSNHFEQVSLMTGTASILTPKLAQPSMHIMTDVTNTLDLGVNRHKSEGAVSLGR